MMTMLRYALRLAGKMEFLELRQCEPLLACRTKKVIRYVFSVVFVVARVISFTPTMFKVSLDDEVEIVHVEAFAAQHFVFKVLSRAHSVSHRDFRSRQGKQGQKDQEPIEIDQPSVLPNLDLCFRKKDDHLLDLHLCLRFILSTS